MAADNLTQTQWHTWPCHGHSFRLPTRYQDPQYIGQGAFGIVIRATDSEINKPVAIKKMLQPFQNTEHAKRAYRELRLLMHLNHSDAQVLQLRDVFTPDQSIADFQTFYFVFNYVDYDLHRIIRAQTPFTEEHIKQVIYSLLRGLKFIHSAGVIHRDLKPSNIGIDANSNVTILDFGLSRILGDGAQTGYVATRWWRAPEVYVNWEQYDEKLDTWAVGCIMAELILHRPLFCGRDHIDQLNKIFDTIGTPELTTLDKICSPGVADYIKTLPYRPRVDFNQLFGFNYADGEEQPVSGISPQGIDLLEKLLSFDHRTRPTAAEALAHPFMNELHDPVDEPTIEPMIDVHQDAEYNIAQWRSIIWYLIQDFLPPSWINDDVNGD